MTFSHFDVRAEAGFDVLAGRAQGLRRLMVVSGRLPEGDVGPMHVHHGDEVLRVVSGVVLVRCGDERRKCGPGDLVSVAPGTPHGFRVLEETVLEVVAEYDIGTLYPVLRADGSTELVEAYRPDQPWGRPPPAGRGWTTDDEMAQIIAELAQEV